MMRDRSDRGRKRLRRGVRRRTPRPPGGKALQRLFIFLGQRDPAINDDVVATVPAPKEARPGYALTKQAQRAKPVTTASAVRASRRPPAARSFAAAIVKAAESLPHGKQAQPRRGSSARMVRMAPPP